VLGWVGKSVPDVTQGGSLCLFHDDVFTPYWVRGVTIPAQHLRDREAYNVSCL
jgi:hypothetical protein